MAEQQAVPGRGTDPRSRLAVMQRLARWRRFTVSDLLALLSPGERLGFHEQTLEDLKGEGLIDVRDVGDEAVISLTDAGARWLEHQGQREGQ